MSMLTKNPVIKYFREAREELNKVTWPSQKDTIRYSLIVIAISLVCAIYFGALDWILSLGLDGLINITR